VDWREFLRLVQFHRIEGLAWNALAPAALPADIRETLAEAASAIAANDLRARSECRLLQSTFEAEGVPLLFLKGATLGALAYGNPSLKSAIDIDLLIDPADLGRAAAVLRKCGYRLVAPQDSPDDRVLRAWHRGWKESVWANALQLDLHTRTADNPRLIPGIGVHSASQRVDVGDDIRLPTLADEELFAYLTVHGASAAWFRLKWVSDFAGFLHGRGASEIERLYYRSQELGAGRAAGQALLLAHELFRTLDETPGLREDLPRDGSTLRLWRTALRLLTAEPSEPTDRRWGTLPIHLMQFGLMPGLAYKLSEFSRQARRALTRGA
jgi:hypothetical protein